MSKIFFFCLTSKAVVVNQHKSTKIAASGSDLVSNRGDFNTRWLNCALSILLKIFIDVNEKAVCNTYGNLKMAHLLHTTALVVCDECSMTGDKVFKDIWWNVLRYM